MTDAAIENASATAGSRHLPAGRTRHNRSRITNGSKFLPGVHSQSVWARIVRDIVDDLAAQVGGSPSTSQMRAIRRAAFLEAELVFQEDLIGRMRCAGKEPSIDMLDLYSRLGNAQRRWLEPLGWESAPSDPIVTLKKYLELREQVRALDAVVEPPVAQTSEPVTAPPTPQENAPPAAPEPVSTPRRRPPPFGSTIG